MIHFSEDARSGQTVAHLTLNYLSGGASSWLRTNYLFLKVLRKHFLDWRVVPEAEKLGFLQRARRLLDAPAELVEEAQKQIDARLAALVPAEQNATAQATTAETPTRD